MTNASTSSTITPLVDAALTHLFTVRMRLGQFDARALQLPWGGYGLEHVSPHATLHTPHSPPGTPSPNSVQIKSG